MFRNLSERLSEMNIDLDQFAKSAEKSMDFVSECVGRDFDTSFRGFILDPDTPLNKQSHYRYVIDIYFEPIDQQEG